MFLAIPLIRQQGILWPLERQRLSPRAAPLRWTPWTSLPRWICGGKPRLTLLAFLATSTATLIIRVLSTSFFTRCRCTGQAGCFQSQRIRNTDEHFFFVGADENFTPDLTGSIRVGGEFLDYYKIHTSRLSPYVDASLKWQFTPQSSTQFGVKHLHSSSDVTGFSTPVLDTDTTAVYASVNHNITERFTIGAMGQAQWSTFVDTGDAADVGSIDGDRDDFYVGGINLAYHFNPWFLAEAGYDFSRLDSQIAFRSYTRNQVYFGVRGTY